MRGSFLLPFAVLTLPVSALAQNTGSTGVVAATQGARSALSAQDTNFIKAAVQAGFAEVRDGQIAESKGDATVQKVATQMVADHGKANAQLKALALAKGQLVPATPTAKQAAMSQKLQGLNGAAFDSRYLKGQRWAHEQAIKLFRAEATAGSDSDVKSFAANTLPVLQMHLQMIESALK